MQKISATIENDKIILQDSLAQIEQDLKEQQKLLEEEKENSEKLLMGYDLSLGTKSQSITDSRKAINANTVRILLLERQNKKLRQISVNSIAEESKGFEVILSKFIKVDMFNFVGQKAISTVATIYCIIEHALSQ